MLSNTSLSELRKHFANISVAMCLNAHFLSFIIKAYYSGLGGHELQIVFVISYTIMFLSSTKIRFDRYGLLIVFSILAFYIITYVIFPQMSEANLIDLINYSILPFAIFWLEVDFERIVKNTLLLSYPALFVLQKIFIRYRVINQVITMSLSYAVLPSVICAVAYLVYYRKRNRSKKIIYLFSCFVNMYYVYEMFAYGSRGPVFSIIIMLIVVCFFRSSKSNDKVTSHSLKLFFASSVFFLIVLLFGDAILNHIIDFLNENGIYLRFLKKNIDLYNISDLSHGRIEIYRKAIEGFLNSPLWGNGFDMFHYNTGIVFPHNLLLQFAYDGGIIMLLCIVFPIVKTSIHILKRGKYSEFIKWLTLFCISVPGAMVSNDIWKKYTFWVFVAFCLRDYYLDEKSGSSQYTLCFQLNNQDS